MGVLCQLDEMKDCRGVCGEETSRHHGAEEVEMGVGNNVYFVSFSLNRDLFATVTHQMVTR